MKINYPHLLNRICSYPLAIEPRHLNPILGFLGTRMGVDFVIPVEAAVSDNAESDRNFPDVPANVAVVDVSGPLVRKASGLDALCGMCSYQQIEQEFTEALGDPSKQAILMVLDSPGGEVGGLFDLSDLIYQARGQKPVFAVISEMAFSAAYALASACDQIFVSRTGGAGSVGVFTAHCDQSGWDKQAGLAFTYVYAGKKKVDGNPHEPLSSEAQATIQAEVDRTYDLFVQTVSRNRKLSARSVKGTEAGLFFGAEAVNIGFADQIGTVAEAVKALQEAVQPSAEKTQATSAETAPMVIEAPVPASQDAPLPDAEAAAVVQAPVAAASAPNSTKEAEQMDEITPDAAAPEKLAITEPTKKRAADPEPDPKDPKEDEEDENEAKKAAASAKEIVFLCEVANRNDLVAGFIKNGTSLAEVRKTLLEGKAAEQSSPGGIGHHVSPISGNSLDQLDSMAKARAAQSGKSFAAAYAEVLRENPRLYVQYLDQKDAATGVRR